MMNIISNIHLFLCSFQGADTSCVVRRAAFVKNNPHNLQLTSSRIQFVLPASAPQLRVSPNAARRTPNNESGGDERDRTDDLLRARQALSQLSYIPRNKLTNSISLKTDFTLSTFKNFNDGGHRWTRTTDLTLIRRAL
jgi:hypothetical protein